VCQWDSQSDDVDRGKCFVERRWSSRTALAVPSRNLLDIETPWRPTNVPGRSWREVISGVLVDGEVLSPDHVEHRAAEWSRRPLPWLRRPGVYALAKRLRTEEVSPVLVLAAAVDHSSRREDESTPRGSSVFQVVGGSP